MRAHGRAWGRILSPLLYVPDSPPWAALCVALNDCQEPACFEPFRNGRIGVLHDAAKSNDQRAWLALTERAE
jgi:hypothetical protein